MPSSYFIARLVGPVFTVVGIGLVINRETYRQVAGEFLSSTVLIYGTGVLMLTSGLAILNTHPRWTHDWRSLITLIGWVLSGIGVFRIFAPDLVMFVRATASNTFLTITAAFLLATGGFLTFKGYVAEMPRSPRRES